MSQLDNWPHGKGRRQQTSIYHRPVAVSSRKPLVAQILRTSQETKVLVNKMAGAGGLVHAIIFIQTMTIASLFLIMSRSLTTM
jgi:hypothetical protein